MQGKTRWHCFAENIPRGIIFLAGLTVEVARTILTAPSKTLDDNKEPQT
jgi:hypothetical protein